MSILPRCTCDRFGSGFGEFSDRCPRHWQAHKWMREQNERRLAELANLRERALTRPVHGGYPDAPKAAPAAEVDRDTDGELLIDWSPSPGRMITLSLRDDGRLSYALIWDEERAHGTAQMPA